MTANQATALLQTPALNLPNKTVWADLGAGNGTFTLALAGLLQPESIIYAVDTNPAALRTIPALYNQVVIEKQVTDFIEDKLSLSPLDGILMANSLHYVRDKVTFLEKTNQYLTEKSYFLIVEYDTDRPVERWVPYPVSYNSLKKVFTSIGNFSIHKIHTQPSVYGAGEIYSALIIM